MNLIGTYIFCYFIVLSLVLLSHWMFKRMQDGSKQKKRQNEEKKGKKCGERAHIPTTHKSCQLPDDKIYSCTFIWRARKSCRKPFACITNGLELNSAWHRISYHQFSYNVYNFYYYRSTWILSFVGFLCYECECEKNHWEKRKKNARDRAFKDINEHKNDTWRIPFFLDVCAKLKNEMKNGKQC